MAQRSSRTPIALSIFLAALLQALFAVADTQETPYRTAIAFSQAYFQFDPDMANLLCKAALNQEESPVERYLYAMQEEARSRGYDPSALKSALYDIETHTLQQGAAEAEVRLTAERRSAINPVFAFVARFFNLGEVQHIDQTLKLVLEEGRWKVCGQPFALTQG
jgi:hypothetical protein